MPVIDQRGEPLEDDHPLKNTIIFLNRGRASKPENVPAGSKQVSKLKPKAKRVRRASGHVGAAIRELVLASSKEEEALASFNLLGRGHEPRVTLDRSLARILRKVDLPRVKIPGYGANTFYPKRIFVRAIALLEGRFKESPVGFSESGNEVIRRE